MRYVGKIDKEKYRCITEDIVTDEVIITDERIGHIKERHPNDYECYNFHRVKRDCLRWKISCPSTRRWLDRGNPRDAGEWHACQTIFIYFELGNKRTSEYFTGVLFYGKINLFWI